MVSLSNQATSVIYKTLAPLSAWSETTKLRCSLALRSVNSFAVFCQQNIFSDRKSLQAGLPKVSGIDDDRDCGRQNGVAHTQLTHTHTR
jgi:hypothetical protein